MAKYVARKDMAAMLGISTDTLDPAVRRHRIPVLRFGRRIVFDEAAIAALETACRTTPLPPLRIDYWTPSAPPARRKKSDFDALREQLIAGSKPKRRDQAK